MGNVARGFTIRLSILTQLPASRKVKTNLPTRHWLWADCQEISFLLECVEQVLGVLEPTRHQVGEILRSIVLQHQEHLQTIRSPSTLGRQIRKIIYIIHIRALVVEQIPGRKRECVVESPHIAPQQERTCHRRPEHFVRVDCDGVCELDAREAGGRERGVEDDAPAPRPVDVQPQIVSLADRAEFRERIVRAVHGGAGCCVDEEWRFAPFLTLFDEPLQFVGAHASGVVDGYADDVFAAEAEEVGGFFDGVVAVG